MVLIPKLINRITSQVIIKEVPIYRIKEVTKTVEVPVFKGEKIIEKEKIVYQPSPVDEINVTKLGEHNYRIAPIDKIGIGWYVRVANDGVFIWKDGNTFDAYYGGGSSVSANSVSWN